MSVNVTTELALRDFMAGGYKALENANRLVATPELTMRKVPYGAGTVDLREETYSQPSYTVTRLQTDGWRVAASEEFLAKLTPEACTLMADVRFRSEHVEQGIVIPVLTVPVAANEAVERLLIKSGLAKSESLYNTTPSYAVFTNEDRDGKPVTEFALSWEGFKDMDKKLTAGLAKAS